MSGLVIALAIGFIIYIGFKSGPKSRGSSCGCECNDDD